jgi:hypothetical protein
MGSIGEKCNSSFRKLHIFSKPLHIANANFDCKKIAACLPIAFVGRHLQKKFKPGSSHNMGSFQQGGTMSVLVCLCMGKTIRLTSIARTRLKSGAIFELNQRSHNELNALQLT